MSSADPRCHDCGGDDAVLIAEDTADPSTGYVGTLYLCRACADRREGIEPELVDEHAEVYDRR